MAARCSDTEEVVGSLLLIKCKSEGEEEDNYPLGTLLKIIKNIQFFVISIQRTGKDGSFLDFICFF